MKLKLGVEPSVQGFGYGVPETVNCTKNGNITAVYERIPCVILTKCSEFVDNYTVVLCFQFIQLRTAEIIRILPRWVRFPQNFQEPWWIPKS